METQSEIATILKTLRSSGRSLPEAIVDLVDNSIDAGARNIMVRFVRTQSSLQQLQVIDDGQGMTEAQAVNAIRFGSRTDDGNTSGKLGMGLPVATASSAGGLTVLSKTRKHGTIGLRWNLEETSSGLVVERLDPEWVESNLPTLDSGSGTLSGSPGTVIQWDRVHDFSRAADRGVDKYLERSFREIRLHLGLHFHRFIERGRVNISICSFDVDTGRNELISEVGALNPFGYPEPGRSGYPRPFLVIDEEHGDLELTAHIWPKNSKLDQYRLDGTAGRQGLYFYRNDRLLHGGGWCHSREDAEPHLSLARVAIDLPKSWQSVIRVRFNKSGVEVPASFGDSLLAARSVQGNRPFSRYVDDADALYRDRSGSTPVLKKILPPGGGIPSAVRGEIGNSFPLHRLPPVEIVWKDLPSNTFFTVNRSPRKPAITINKKYRRAILAERHATGVDAPMLKTLLFLTLQEHCSKARVTAKDRLYLNALNRILVQAARSE